MGPRRPEAYKVRLPGKWLYIIGPYGGAPTGGIDPFMGRPGFTSAMLVEVLERYHKLGSNVLFEGAVISTFYGALGEWLEVNRSNTVVGFLDTSLDDCLAGIGARSGKNTKNVASKIPAILRVKDRMDAAGIRTEMLSRATAFETVKGWLV